MGVVTRLLGAAFIAACGINSASAQSCEPKVAPPEILEAGKLSMMINPTEPPMQFVDENGKIQGLNAELSKLIADQLCLEIQLEPFEFAAMIPALKAGRFDGIFSGHFWTEERSKIFYVVPYAQQGVAVVARSEDDRKIEDIDDLSGLSAGLQTNSYQERKIKEMIDKMTAEGKEPLKLLVFNSAAEGVAAFRAGQVDVFITTNDHARELERRGGVKVMLSNISPTDLVIMYAKKSLADATIAALTELRANGSYKQVFEKFGMMPIADDRPFEIRGTGPQ